MTDMRECKKCKIVKSIDNFQIVKNPKLKNISRRWSCSQCMSGSRKDYLKTYHKINYVKKERPKKYKKIKKNVCCPSCQHNFLN